MCYGAHDAPSTALGQARIMQPTTAALGDAPQAPLGFKLSTSRLGAECDTDYATGASVELCTQGNWRWPDLLPFSLVDSAVLEDVFSRHQGFITWAESSCPYTEFCV